ncbi:hypothetical protein NEHOM01_1783 [Nematocida homosporus]|uniref:uncharacterized protein n=1 Tax=Nematocida homosporus TaxID=1912981 RepID=UPI00221EDBA5|nr:uncharacterized protein NEHOM01_1783 [Nematocida homosporus]KAI5186894.1 hypothetical protein NEHOM01_1783 [Nematocida homosporus]
MTKVFASSQTTNTEIVLKRQKQQKRRGRAVHAVACFGGTTCYLFLSSVVILSWGQIVANWLAIFPLSLLEAGSILAKYIAMALAAGLLFWTTYYLGVLYRCLLCYTSHNVYNQFAYHRWLIRFFVCIKREHTTPWKLRHLLLAILFLGGVWIAIARDGPALKTIGLLLFELSILFSLVYVLARSRSCIKFGLMLRMSNVLFSWLARKEVVFGYFCAGQWLLGFTYLFWMAISLFTYSSSPWLYYSLAGHIYWSASLYYLSGLHLGYRYTEYTIRNNHRPSLWATLTYLIISTGKVFPRLCAAALIFPLAMIRHVFMVFKQANANQRNPPAPLFYSGLSILPLCLHQLEAHYLSYILNKSFFKTTTLSTETLATRYWVISKALATGHHLALGIQISWQIGAFFLFDTTLHGPSSILTIPTSHCSISTATNPVEAMPHTFWSICFPWLLFLFATFFIYIGTLASLLMAFKTLFILRDIGMFDTQKTADHLFNHAVEEIDTVFRFYTFRKPPTSNDTTTIDHQNFLSNKDFLTRLAIL